MAEAYLKDAVAKLGIEIEVESAGTDPSQGMYPPSEALERIGHRAAYEHRAARLVTPEMLTKADLILVMEEHHKKRLQTLSPAESTKVHLLLDFDPAPDPHHREMGIPDPYRMSSHFYDNVNEIIRQCCDELIKRLKQARK